MIFYFTGTGNSLSAAKSILNDGERLISIAAAVKSGQFRFEAGKGEPVGFVFPVYWYTLPVTVADFVRKLELKCDGYVYAVITCGGGIGQAGGLLKSELYKRGIELNAVFPLVTADNAVFYYNIAPAAKAKQLLREADGRLKLIIGKIRQNTATEIGGKALAEIFARLYRLSCGTSKFYVSDACVSCGKCAENCPADAIEIRGGRPVWVKPVCVKCASCINRCPVQAIQYGKATEKRNRYVNPNLP